jgi:hypothetical protein
LSSCCPSCSSTLSPISSFSSMRESSIVAHRLHGRSHDVPSPRTIHSLNHPPPYRHSAVVPPTSQFAPVQVVLGIVCYHFLLNPLHCLTHDIQSAESIVVPATLSDSSSFQPSPQAQNSMILSPVVPKLHKQHMVTAETLLPDDSISSSRCVYH